MNILRRRGWVIEGDRIWSDSQGPFLEGLDFFILKSDEPRKLGVGEENGYTLLRIRYDENIREKLLPYLESS